MAAAPLIVKPSDIYETPHEVFSNIDWYMGPFTLDVAAHPENAKCKAFFTEADDALKQSWAAPRHPTRDAPGFAWCNPPYSKGWLDAFTTKAVQEALLGHGSVLLIPAYTSSSWWSRNVWMADITPTDVRQRWPGCTSYHYRGARLIVSVWFLPGRVSFLKDGKKTGSPTFASAAIKYEAAR